MLNKKALLLFTNSPLSEAFSKNVFSDKNINEPLIRTLLNKVIQTISDTKKILSFDIIIATGKTSSERFNNNLYNQLPKLKTIFYEGNNFGERFTNSLYRVFSSGYEQVIVIGNDCPDIDANLIVQSFGKLKNRNTVVGPSTDGGFYLLGLNNFEQKLFNNIEWNTGKVLAQLLCNLSKMNEEVYLLHVLSDIDNHKSLSDWLALKTKASELINSIINNLSSIPCACSLFTPPFNKENYYSRRSAQKSPPVK